jgi:ribonuclease D
MSFSTGQMGRKCSTLIYALAAYAPSVQSPHRFSRPIGSVAQPSSAFDAMSLDSSSSAVSAASDAPERSQTHVQDNFQVCDRDLDAATLARYLQAPALAIDTETMGLVPQRDRLCLVQICDPEGYVTALRIERGQRSAPHLKQLLEATHSLKIFHFARFDLATLRYHLDVQTASVFCTKIASKLARTYAPRHGLKEVVNELTGVELDKSAQSSDWGNAANLSDQQLAYAANDVRYLIAVQQRLATMLQREERMDLAQACFDFLPSLVALDLAQFNNVFEH